MITSHSTLPMRLRCLECIYWSSTTIEALRRRPALALAGPQGTPEALGECVLHRGCVILTELGSFVKLKSQDRLDHTCSWFQSPTSVCVTRRLCVHQ